MTTNEMLPEKFARLRRQAEERIKRWPNLASIAPADLPEVIHELKIHLAELEIQNEELKRELQQMAERQDKELNIHASGPLKNKIDQFSRDYHRVMAHRNASSKEENKKVNRTKAL